MSDDRDLAALKSELRQAGLFRKRPAYYARKLAEAGALVTVSLGMVVTAGPSPLQLISAVLLAVAFTQIGFLGHDAGHRQVFQSEWKNDALGLAFVPLIMGFSYGWWVEKHNRHHVHPNRLDHDPDIDFPMVIFTPEQLTDRPNRFRFIIRHQALFFFPLLTFLAYSLRRDAIRFLWQRRSAHRAVDTALLLAHGCWYGALVFSALGLGYGLAFVAVHQAFLGVFLGSAFAINHKGMPILGHTDQLSYLERQVLTTRNLRAHPVTDFWYGPLACQIEHHLFPGMPRCHLRRAAPFVRRFCAARGVAYHETGVAASYREVLGHLHSVSAPLRTS